MSFNTRFAALLAQKKADAAWRRRPVRQFSQGQSAVQFGLDGRQYLSFASNDYLGLANHPDIAYAFAQGIALYGHGSAASAYVTGFTSAHADLEQSLATWQGYDAAVLFESGFAANQALVFTLLQKQDCLIADKFMHASLQEAAHLSPAKFCRFAHENMAQLQKHLQDNLSANTLVATEGIFSMDGDAASLVRIQKVCQDAGAWLLVDEAHSIGVMGEGGRGICHALAIEPEIKLLTFGKAFGLSGAAILCDAMTADYLRQTCRALIYSTAMVPAQAYALQSALAVIEKADNLRQALQNNIAYFKAGVRQLGKQDALLPSDSAIQPWIVGSNEALLLAANHLKEVGIWVGAIRPPTVPHGQARLRITLSAAHSQNDMDALLQGLQYV
jgi:8-amino-7-oxononanoate synthase